MAVGVIEGAGVIVVGVLNTVAAVIFAAALCWRLEQIRREGGGLQSVAMTVAIAALTLAYVVSGDDVTAAIDSVTFVGAARVLFYALLAVGVAALIVVFFFPGRSTTRERRAGIEAVPLVVALIGLQITMLVIPTDLRTEGLSVWTARNIAYALFVLIASAYLTYGFVACVRSIRQFLRLAEGYLRTSLGLLLGGLVMLTAGTVLQIVFVVGSSTRSWHVRWLLDVSAVLSVIGVVLFLIGISYPMLRARWHTISSRRRHRRDVEALAPLWQLVTDAVPEVVLPVGGTPAPTMTLHRRVVEIRDALTQLSPYLTDDFGVVDEAARAEMLWAAVEEYQVSGRPRGAVRELVPGGPDLAADADPLLRLSAAVARLETG
ncbi:MAB_1171c family putative transporter [Gordonia sp. LSe1-13]|uniref:MAB_1171c family putative transporter n=1 Tax=Gordonia sesuvii TaxID=3116777 RepID=A0ABU7MGR3_9ACTN|nr:MAB_1171c family putative transporter [Gordonia sp. LSe1-13]